MYIVGKIMFIVKSKMFYRRLKYLTNLSRILAALTTTNILFKPYVGDFIGIE